MRSSLATGRGFVWLGLVAWLIATGSGCSEVDAENEVRASVAVLVNHEGPPVHAAAERLLPHGGRAVVVIESALHTAPEPGRKNLILALRRLRNHEAVPLLRHVALHDASPAVRREARWTLRQWSLERGALGDEARAALRAIDEQAGTQEEG